MFYSRPANQIWLAGNTGASWFGPLTLGTAAGIQNSQCIVNGLGSSSSGTGNNLTVNLALTFKAAFAGTKTVWMLASDGTVDSGWQPRGAWTVP